MTQLSDAEIAELERLKQKAPNAIRRLISGAFRRDGETLPDIRRPYFSIPASKDDDDLVATALVAALPALIAAAKAQRDDGWRAINETQRDRSLAPWNGKPVMLWKPRTQEQYMAAWCYGDHPGWCTPDGFEIFGATHWRPLLPSPQETE